MKIIKFDGTVVTVGAGMELSGNDMGVWLTSPEEKEWQLCTGSESKGVFNALIEFLIGREVMFDVGRFIESTRRKEGSKL